MFCGSIIPIDRSFVQPYDFDLINAMCTRHKDQALYLGLPGCLSLYVASSLSHTHIKSKDRSTGRGEPPFLLHHCAVQSPSLGTVRLSRSS